MKNNKQQPLIAIPESINVPISVVRTSANGMKLHVLDCSDEDVVRFSFVLHAGSSFQHLPFQASTTANLLSEGTEKYTSQEIAEKLDFLGSYFDISLDRDYIVITFCSLTKFVQETIEIAEQVLLHPLFSQDEISLYCSKRKQRIAIERSKVAFRAREYFSRALFGATHPYGIFSHESLYDNLTRDDLVKFYKTFYTADNCFAVCSGKITRDVEKMILALSDKFYRGKRVYADSCPEPVVEKFFYEQEPDALQSAIRIGTILFTRSHPDFIAMQIVTTILGGYFGSRLVKNLREEKSYTYGIFATMVNLDSAGYLAIATEVAVAATSDAIEQIYKEIETLRTEMVPTHELTMVKNIVAGEVMRVLDGPFGIADVTIENVQNELDNSYLNRFLDEVRDITPERVQEVASKHLQRELFTTVVVGNIIS